MCPHDLFLQAWSHIILLLRYDLYDIYIYIHIYIVFVGVFVVLMFLVFVTLWLRWIALHKSITFAYGCSYAFSSLDFFN